MHLSLAYQFVGSLLLIELPLLLAIALIDIRAYPLQKLLFEPVDGLQLVHDPPFSEGRIQLVPLLQGQRLNGA